MSPSRPSLHIKPSTRPHGSFSPSQGISQTCIAKAQLLYHLSPGSATLLFFALLFISFCLKAKTVMWTKGVPYPPSERGRFDELNAALRRLEIEADPTLQRLPQPQQLSLSSMHKWMYTPVPGSRGSKFRKVFASVVVIWECDVMMSTCIANIEYCPHAAIYSTPFWAIVTFPNFLQVIWWGSLIMSSVGWVCLLKLAVDVVLVGKGQPEWDFDIFFLQNYFLMMLYMCFISTPFVLIDMLMQICCLGAVFEHIARHARIFDLFYYSDLMMQLWRKACLRLGGRR
jgi:hypothetical protein